MNIAQLVEDLHHRGARLRVEQDKLKITAPDNALDSETVAAVRQHKQAIIDFLLANLPVQTQNAHNQSGKVLPLSFNQKALWSLYRLAPGNPAFNLLFACQLPANVNAKALEAACQILLQRHELLRARFMDTADGPVCTIAADATVPTEHQHTQNLSDAQINALLNAFGDQPFQLEQGAVRFLALHNTVAETVTHYFAFTLHHIIADFWACQLLLGELSLLYASIVERRNTKLPAIQLSYADYARWQQDYLATPQSTTDLEYWKQQLSGQLPVLDIPRDRPRPALMSFRGGSHRHALGAALSQRIREHARQNNVTPSTLMLTAYTVLLHRCSRQQDILVGTPAAHRNISGSEWMVGDFSNPIVVRSQIDSSQTFTQLLKQVQTTFVDAIRHQDYPFPLLVEKLNPVRDASHSPICQAMFLWHKPNEQRLSEILGHHNSILTHVLPMSGQRGATYDLMLSVADIPDGLVCSWSFNSDLFDASTVQRLGQHLECLLQDAIPPASDGNGNTEKPLHALNLLDDATRHKLLHEWNQTGRQYDFSFDLFSRIEQQAAQNPDNIAVHTSTEQLTYHTLLQRVNTLAQQLVDRGAQPGQFIAIALPRTADMIIALLAVLRIRCAYVPVDPDYPPARVAYMIAHSRAATIITHSALQSQLNLEPEQTLCLDTSVSPTAKILPENSPHPQPDDLAYVIYTSGSTGTPKGVRIHHRALLNLLLHFNDELALQPQQRWLSVTSMSFDIAALEIFLPLMSGACIVLANRQQAMDSNWLANCLHTQHIDVMQATPATWQMLTGTWHSNTPPTSQPNLTALCGGEALSTTLANALLPHVARLLNVYGPTETTIWSLTHALQSASALPAPIGRPLANTSLYILDEHLQPTPFGVPGELHIGGIGVSPGYLYRDDLTAERFIPNPFPQTAGNGTDNNAHTILYKTGDLVRYLADGTVEYISRLDHQVKVRGFRIELAEVEAALLAHANVQDAVAVVRIPPGQDAALLAAYIIAREPDIDVRALKRALNLQLPQYMIPSVITVLAEFPLTPNGKIDRNALPEPQYRQAHNSQYVPARDLIEHQLVQIWETVLDTRPISVTDNFFDLGGHSLLAMKLMVQVQQTFRQAPPLSVLFQAPSVETFANIIRLHSGASNRSSNPVLCIKPGAADATPLILVHPVGGSVFCYHELANLMPSHQPVFGLQLPLDEKGNPMIADVSEMGARYAVALREQFGNQPIAIGGWSLGGIIAFDIALRLENQGQPPQDLFIIDSAAPYMKEQIDELHEIAVMIILAKELGVLVEQIFLPRLINVTVDEGLAYVLELCLEHGLLPDTFRIDDLRDRFQLIKSNQAAQKAYVCPQQPYHGRTTILRAQGQPAERPDKIFLGWRAHATDCTAHEIAGDHFTLIRPPFVQSLADQLKALLPAGNPPAASSTADSTPVQE